MGLLVLKEVVGEQLDQRLEGDNAGRRWDGYDAAQQQRVGQRQQRTRPVLVLKGDKKMRRRREAPPSSGEPGI